jgi:cytochrome o ubiquinol oxidase subunit 3
MTRHDSTLISHAEDGEFFYLMTSTHHPKAAARCSGFWIYLMSDCLIFACCSPPMACSAQLCGRPGAADLFDLPLVAVNTSMLLLSSITYGFAMLRCSGPHVGRRSSGWPSPACSAGLHRHRALRVRHLIHEGAGPQRSAFLSSFFTLVGTHGLHVTFGIVWLVTLMVQVGRHGPDRGQPPPPDVPVDVLALPRRGLDRRLHLRLSDGSAAMSASTPHRHHDATMTATVTGRHGTLKGYMTGFVLSVVLTAIPFWLVMGKVFDKQAGTTALVVMAFAAVQIVVHMIYFLHMNTKSEGGWTMLALIFTLVWWSSR